MMMTAIPRARRLSTKEMREILERTPHTVDADLAKLTVHKVFVLSTGGAVVRISDDDGILFEAHEELVAFCRTQQARKQLGPRNTWSMVWPSTRDFVEEVPTLLSALPGLLAMGVSSVGFDEAGLLQVDRAVAKIGRQRVLSAELFPAVLAYVGEAIRRGIQGAWSTRRAGDGLLEPCIVGASGDTCNLVPLYKHLAEGPRTVSLQPFISAEISVHRR